MANIPQTSSRKTARIWQSVRELNAPRALSSVAGAPIAILGGFSLTNAINAAKTPGRWAEVAVGCFGASVIFLIYALLWIIIVTSYTCSPSERLEWVPEADANPQLYDQIREQQREDIRLVNYYHKAITFTTTMGIICTLLGLASLLIATRGNAAVEAVSIALCICCVHAFAAFIRRPVLFFPRPSPDWNNPDGPVPPMTKEQWKAIGKK